jgi:hypothetical protein
VIVAINQNLLFKTASLLHAYLESEEGYLEDDLPIKGFFSSLQECIDLEGVWEPNMAYGLLSDYLDSLQIENHPDVTTDLCETFITRFVEDLRANIEDVWVLIPIGMASCDSVIAFDRFLLLPHQLARDKKLDVLAEYLPVDRESLTEKAAHFERTGSYRYFFDGALFGFHLTHQFDWVYRRAPFLAVWAVAVLRAMFHAEANFEDSEHAITLNFQPWLTLKHVDLIGERNEQTRSVQDADLSCPFSFSWLNSVPLQEKLLALFDSFILKQPDDRLEFRFLRSLRFLSKSIETRQIHEPYTGLALETLFLMMAAESILLDREAEKRLRLSYLLPLFGRPASLPQAEGYEIVQRCYNWRSDYVHSGTDVLPDFDETFKPGEPQHHLYWLRKMVSRLLISGPDLIAFVDDRLEEGVDVKTNKRTRETIWFKYVDECWKAAFLEDRGPLNQ